MQHARPMNFPCTNLENQNCGIHFVRLRFCVPPFASLTSFGASPPKGGHVLISTISTQYVRTIANTCLVTFSIQSQHSFSVALAGIHNPPTTLGSFSEFPAIGAGRGENGEPMSEDQTQISSFLSSRRPILFPDW
jgi:hypothetical protein